MIQQCGILHNGESCRDETREAESVENAEQEGTTGCRCAIKLGLRRVSSQGTVPTNVPLKWATL